MTSDLSIVDTDGNSVCQTLTISEYGIVKCKTITGEMVSKQLRIKQGSDFYECVNSDTAMCLYEQLASSPFPATESTTKTDATIVFTGTNFDIASLTPSATFAGVDADSVVVDSAT